MSARPFTTIDREHGPAFTVVDNALLRDARLALDEKGLLCWFLSLPLDWEVIPAAVRKEHKIGRDKYQRMMKSLRVAGYIKLIIERSEDGTIACIRYRVRAIPLLTGDPAIPEERVDAETESAIEAADASDEPAIPEVQDAGSVAPLQQPENTVVAANHKPGKPDSGLGGSRQRTKSLQNTPPTPQAVPADRPQAAVRDVPSFKLLAAKWPQASILSASTAERRYLRLTEERKRAAFDGVGAYLADMRQRGWKICDLQTYLRDRRWERVKGAAAPEIPIHGNTPQAFRWLDYRNALGQNTSFMDECWRHKKPWYAPTEWPPPLPASASPPASPSRKTG
jgi:hypothetical protein